MIIAGDVHVKGPNLIQRLKNGEEICIEKDHMEFLLKVSDSPKEEVESNPYVQLYDSDISLLPRNDTGGLYSGYFSLTIEDPKGQNIELNFSIDQIRVIKELFDQYLIAFEANRRLEKEYTVKARKEDLS